MTLLYPFCCALPLYCSERHIPETINKEKSLPMFVLHRYTSELGPLLEPRRDCNSISSSSQARKDPRYYQVTNLTKKERTSGRPRYSIQEKRSFQVIVYVHRNKKWLIG